MRKLVGPILFLFLVAEIGLAIWIVMAQPEGLRSIFRADVNIGEPAQTQVQPPQTFDTGGTVGVIQVNNDNGFVRVRGLANTSVVTVNTTKYSSSSDSNAFDRITYRVEKKGNDIIVTGKYNIFGITFGNNRVDIDITAPTNMVANLTTSNGAVTLLDMNNSQARHQLKSDNGTISVGQVKAARVELHDQNGQLNLDNVSAQIWAETNNGRIIANNSTLNIERVKSSNGSIELGNALQQTTDGSIETQNGSIILRFGPNPAVRIDATTSLGSVNYQLGVGGTILQETKHLITAGTGPTLKVKTNLGSITIS